MNVTCYIVEATVAMIINYDCNMPIVEATEAMIINYDHKMFIALATVL